MNSLIRNIQKNYNKNFLTYYGYCINKLSENEYKSYIFIEKSNITLDDLLKSKTLDINDIRSLIFQCLCAIYTIQKLYKAVHNDLKSSNILVNILDKKVILKYTINNQIYYIENVKYIIKISDLDCMSIYKPYKIIRKDIYKNLYIEEYGISNTFRQGYDIATILNYFIGNMPIYLPKDRIERLIPKLFLYNLLKNFYKICDIKVKNIFLDYEYEFRKLEKVQNANLTQLIFLGDFDIYKNKNFKINNYEIIEMAII